VARLGNGFFNHYTMACFAIKKGRVVNFKGVVGVRYVTEGNAKPVPLEKISSFFTTSKKGDLVGDRLLCVMLGHQTSSLASRLKIYVQPLEKSRKSHVRTSDVFQLPAP
jgi:hypothetical protein